jgi:hypothetical protein
MRQAFNYPKLSQHPWRFPDRMLGIPPKMLGQGQALPGSLKYYTEYYEAMAGIQRQESQKRNPS